MISQLIFMGPPGCGKGTQTHKLAEELNLPRIDTGSMLRAVAKEDNPLGRRVKDLIDGGNLAPIEVVASVIKNRLTQDDMKNGFILDGYPRSLEQAEVLDEILSELNKDKEVNLKVINFDMPIETLVERLVNRRTCRGCGKIYNLMFVKPKKTGICDVCSSELGSRKDDTAETAQVRMQTYKKQTKPLIEFYEKRNLLYNVNGNQNIDEVYTEIIETVRK